MKPKQPKLRPSQTKPPESKQPVSPPAQVRITPEMLAAKAPVAIAAHVVQRIHRHARSSMGAEVCGVLIGEESGGVTLVEAAIEGERASQGGAHVTFTQDTWEHIYAVKDKDYPEKRIVGWYHSHPGFGIFLSQHDLFIHENFFSSPAQIAWVYDPHSDEEGCFGWVEGKVKRLGEIRVLELGAGDAPVLGEEPDEIPEHGHEETPAARPEDDKDDAKRSRTRLKNRMLMLLALGVMFTAGLAAGLFLFPRSLVMYSLPDGRLLNEEQMRQAIDRAIEFRNREQDGGQRQSESPGSQPTTPGAPKQDGDGKP